MSHLARSIQRVHDLLSVPVSNSTLHHVLNDYFRHHREMGSRDRRFFREVAYTICRIGNALHELSFQERLAVASFLTGGSLLQQVPELREGRILTLPEPSPDLENRLGAILGAYPEFRLEEVFPFADRLSPSVPAEQYIRSLFVQPDVWIRVRRQQTDLLAEQLSHAGIPFSIHPDFPCSWSVPQGAALDKLSLQTRTAFQVQDLASQLVCQSYHPSPGEAWWDLCAASGGKSIALLDSCLDIELLASDVRPAIVSNLQERLKGSGYDKRETAVIDAAEEGLDLGRRFDAILADVPCSGSGTWSRTPEQLRWFDPNTLERRFHPLQKSILSTATRHLKSGGKIHYSTCSVFESENEQLVNWAVDSLGLELVHYSYISRYFDRADTLFLAVLAKS